MDPYYFLNPNLHASSGARAGGIADFSADAASGPRVCKDSPGHGLPCLVMLQTVRLPDGVNGEYNLGIQGRQLGITSANSRERTEGGERKPSGSHRGPPALRPFLKPVSSMRKSPPFPKRKGQFGHA